jgi:hypothetical protein
MGLDSLAALYSPLERAALDPAVFDLFFHAIVTVELTRGVHQPVFALVALIARSGFAAVLVPWYTSLLANASIPGRDFMYIGSVIMAFLQTARTRKWQRSFRR